MIHTTGAQEIGSPVRYEGMIVADEEEIQLSFPSYVMAEPFMNEIYLLDGRARILVYTSDFFPLYTLDKNDGIHSPQGIAVDTYGNLYVAQSKTDKYPRHRISVFNACFRWERDIYFKGFEGAESFVPYRMVLDKKGNIYVAREWFDGILILNNKGDLIEILSPEEDKRKVKINNVTLDKEGNIYLVSADEGRIYVYDENRKFIFKFGEKGGSSGKLSQPKAIGIDEPAGRMYVVDYMRHAVNVYNDEGEYLFEFGGLGWGEGWFQFPIDLSVDDAGRVLVADFFNKRVQIFKTR
jgi:DNA-binding beta-propeller fold protein YncE